MNWNWFSKHADQLLAALTSILSGGYLAHLFSQEWIVLIAALLTFAATFIKPKEEAEVAKQATPKKT